MPQQDEAYVIPDVDLLESLKRDPRRKVTRSQVSSPPAASIPLSMSAAGAAQGQVVPIAADLGPTPRVRAASRADSRAVRLHPFAASSLSIFVWGSGQLLNNSVQTGLLLMTTQVLALVGHWSLMKAWPGIQEIGAYFTIGEWSLFRFFALADLALVVAFVFNVAHAYVSARRTRLVEGIRSPIISGAASILLPGWGQILNAQIGKAGFFLTCLASEVYLVLLLTLTPLERIASEAHADTIFTRDPILVWGVLLVSACLTWALSVWDAVIVAEFRRKFL